MAKAKTVKMRIDKIPGLRTEDVIIGVNGVNYQIPRGKTVEVPDFVYAEFERSRRAEEKLYDMQEAKRYKDPTTEKEAAIKAAAN